TVVVLTDDSLGLGRVARQALAPAGNLVARAAKAEGFKGKQGKILELIAPASLKADRLMVLGLGKLKELKPTEWIKLGGKVMARIPSAARAVTVLFELPEGAAQPGWAAEFALGMQLRSYRFDRYKTRKKEDGDNEAASPAIAIAVANAAAVRKEWAAQAAIADGVAVARDLVNEPPNVLFPIEFARRASALKKLGVGVDVLDARAMKKLGMN